MEHIRTKTSCANNYGRAFEVTQRTRQLEQFHSLLQRDRLYALFARHLGKAGFFGIVGSTNLNDRSETADLDKDGTSAFGIVTQLALTGLMFLTGVHGLFDSRFELLIEALHHVCPLLTTLCNFIKVLFYLSGEVVVHNSWEELHQEVVDNDTNVGR